jgi:hypothetical protein
MKTWSLALAFVLAAASVSAQTPSTITAPVAASTLTGDTVTFSWAAGVDIVRYWLEVGTTAGGNELYSPSGSSPDRSAIVTGLPTDGRTVYARLYSVSSAEVWYLRDTTYKAFSPVPVLVVALSRLGWTQPGQTVVEASAGVTRLVIDGVGAGTAIAGRGCRLLNGATDCDAPLPALTPGAHTLALTYTPKGGVVTAKSNVISVTTTVTLTPTNLALRP